MFFILVHSVLYRMRALREGDKYFIKNMVYEARKKTYADFLLFVLGYSLLTTIVVMIGYFEQVNGGEFSSFKIFIYIVEGCKLILD